MHKTKILILTINMVLYLPIAASQVPTISGPGYFAWFKGLFTRQKPTTLTPPTVSAPEKSKPVSQSETKSVPTSLPAPEESKPILSPAQKILQSHYLSLTKQLNEASSAAKDLSYEEIRELELIDLDADIAYVEQKIEALGNVQIRKKASDLISKLSELVEFWRKYGDKQQYKENIDKLALYTLVAYETSISTFLSKVDPVTYRYMLRLGDKVLKQAYFMHHGIAALSLPKQGIWKEVYDLVQDICNANNMPIPKLYYGESKSSFMILPSTTYSSPIIFIPKQYTQSSHIEKLKGAVVHELGHLYYGDYDVSKRDPLK